MSRGLGDVDKRQGLGDPNHVTWGYMIGVARTALRVAWWMTAIPGFMILIAVMAINLA